MTTLAIKIPGISHAQFWGICQVNQDLHPELTVTGEVIARPPTHSWTGKQNSGLTAQLWNWNESTELGVVFDSSTGFTLSNGAVRSPEVAWISGDRWNRLTEEQQRHKFSPITPALLWN